MRQVRLAMIGAGRAAESLHLPAAAFASGAKVSVVVDKDIERARRLAAVFDVPEVRSDAGEAAELADAAVVALPHHLHAPVARQLLERGLHVLVEKPLAMTGAECEELIDLARHRNLVLAAGMVRRLFPSARFVGQALASGLLGPVEGVTLREGHPFSWQVASDYAFRRETGGGVLADIGVHVFDLLEWWFGGLDVTAYRDDAHGGVDADCEVELVSGDGTPIFVELSRTRTLPGTVTIVGERGTLTASTSFEPTVTFSLPGGSRGDGGQDMSLTGEAHEGDRQYRNVRELFIEQMNAFIVAVQGHGRPVVEGVQAAAAVKLLERCMAVREPLPLPWFDPDSEVAA